MGRLHLRQLVARADPDRFRANVRAVDRALRSLARRLVAHRAQHALRTHLQLKLVFLNYSECYHCPIVHPQLEKLSPSESGRNDFSDGPFLGGYSELRAEGTSLSMSGRSPRASIGEVAGAELNRTYYYTIFPSMLLSLHADYAMVHYCNPLAVDRTEVICAWLFAPDEIERAGFDPSDVVEFWDLTNRQDWHVNELTRRHDLARVFARSVFECRRVVERVR